MTTEEIINYLYLGRTKYKGIQLVVSLLNNNEEFRNKIILGIKHCKIKPFTEEIWNKLNSLNIRGPGVFEDVFINGYNIGACTVASKYFSYIFDSCHIAGGVNKYLINTTNSVDGSHTWLMGPDKMIYDTSFMFSIDSDYQKELGYIQENIKKPEEDSNYSAAKEYATDPSIKSSSRK